MTRTLRPAVLHSLLLATLLALTSPQVALSSQAAEEAAQAHAQQALELASSPRAVAHLMRLHGLMDDVEDLHLLVQTYGQVLGRRSADPLTRATANLLLLETERARGRLVRATELRQGLGFLSDFYVVGGFDNEGKAGCDTDFGPEAAALDLGATYAGARGRQVSWRKLTLEPTDGYVDLGSSVRPNREAVAYALTWLQAPTDTKVGLALGTSGAFRLWVNGEKVASSNNYNLPRPDQARVAVRLRKGLNRVLLKVCQDTGPMGFYLRQESLGSRLAQPTLPDAAPPLGRGASAAPQVLPTATSALRELVARSLEDATLRGEYATVLDSFRAYDEREHTAAVEAERAARAAPENAELQLLAARLERDDANLRRGFLEAAVHAAPESVAARVALAGHEMERGHPERVPGLLAPLREKAPQEARVRLTLARAWEALDEGARAHALVEETFRLHPRLPRVVRAAASASRALDRRSEALARLRVALALRFDDRESRRSLAALLADAGQPEEAAREYAQLLTLDPFDNGARVRLAELKTANGKLEEALPLFAEARALSPDEPELPEREGRALLAAGRRDQALAAFERSLALRPQNPSMREAVRTLRGEEEGTVTRYVVSTQELLPEAAAMAGEDAVILVDNTYVRVQRSGLSGRFQQLAVKVLNQRGVDAFRSFPITYSPDRQEVQVLFARITKPDGSVVEAFGDTERNLNEPWTGMYYDSRARVLSFPALAPGDALELHYRLDDTAQENLLSDYWGDVESVQSTYPKLRYHYRVEMPRERPLYWNEGKVAGVAHTREELEGGRVLYHWSARQVAKVVPEPAMPGWAEVSPLLHVSTYRTWEDVGRYWWGLVRDQLTPNEELHRTVAKVLEGVDRKDELAVVRAVYNFVVTNTRYVALEFGIHGYKPYRVDRVLARRFGDCKDKASLIHSMLKVAGVDTRLVLLRMRNLGVLGQEPASLAAFNHAIVYVPRFDLYLDGTAEFHGAHELPSADRVANVLIVNPEGKSTFLTTPEARPEDNLTRLEMEVVLKADGGAEATGLTGVKGSMAPEYRRAYQSASSRRTTFERAWAQSFPGLKAQEVKLSDLGRLDEEVQATYRMSIPRYAEPLPGALRFLPFGGGRSYTQTYASLAERRFDLVLSGPWMNRFRLRYTLPAGYTVGELPPSYAEETPFGRVRLSYRVEEGKVVCEGEVALTAARVKAGEYGAFRAFLGRVDQAFDRKVLLRAPGGTPTAGR